MYAQFHVTYTIESFKKIFIMRSNALSTKQAWFLRSIKNLLHFCGLSLRDRSIQRSFCGFREFFVQKIAYYSYT